MASTGEVRLEGEARPDRLVVTTCPGCGGTAGAVEERVRWDTIWPALEAEFRVTVPPATRTRYEVGETTDLVACVDCQLRFFTPAVPGGPDFYALLASEQGYYNEVTWDSATVAALVDDTDDVVDFGCGGGALLRLLPTTRSGRAVGVDSNPLAIESLNAAGIEGCTDDFEDFARRESGAFDVACAMQVLEHLPDAAPPFRAARQVLRPGGRFFVAVPDYSRERERFEPLDCPPHHVSRWVAEDFHRLAARFGFEVVAVRRDRNPAEALRRELERRIPGRRTSWFVSRVAARTVPARAASAALAHWAPDVPTVAFALLVELRPVGF